MKLMQGMMVVVVVAVLHQLFNPYPLAELGRALMAYCRPILMRLYHAPFW